MNAELRTRKLRPVMWALVVGALVALGLWQTGALAPSPRSGDSRAAVMGDTNPGLVVFAPDKRSKAPRLEGTTLDGDAFTLSEYSGNVIVVNVWGSWCGPCRAETPDLVRLAREDADRGVRFLGIDTRDNLASAKAFAKKFEMPYPSLFDEGGRVLLPLRGVIPTAVIPSSVVIDPQGNVAARVIGPVTYNTLKGVLDDELGGGET